MKRGRFSEEQIVGILKEHEAGRKVSELAGNMESAKGRCTRGRVSTVAWRWERRSA
jgi:hypothetical protein